jgi:hypothetical protein
MAKIKIAGGAAALVSGMKLEDIRLLEKYRPKALTLKEGEEELFKVSSGDTGSVSKFGVCFAAATRDEARLAEFTLNIPTDVTDAKEFAVDKIGPAVLLLNRIETQAAAALTSLNELYPNQNSVIPSQHS